MTFAGIHCTTTSTTRIRVITETVIATIGCARCVPTKSRDSRELIQPTTAGCQQFRREILAPTAPDHDPQMMHSLEGFSTRTHSVPTCRLDRLPPPVISARQVNKADASRWRAQPESRHHRTWLKDQRAQLRARPAFN